MGFPEKFLTPPTPVSHIFDPPPTTHPENLTGRTPHPKYWIFLKPRPKTLCNLNWLLPPPLFFLKRNFSYVQVVLHDFMIGSSPNHCDRTHFKAHLLAGYF